MALELNAPCYNICIYIHIDTDIDMSTYLCIFASLYLSTAEKSSSNSAECRAENGHYQGTKGEAPFG